MAMEVLWWKKKKKMIKEEILGYQEERKNMATKNMNH